MPYSEGQEAVRKYYDPNWGTETPDGAPIKWQVSLRYDHGGSGTENFEIVAATVEEAEQQAVKMFRSSLVYVRGEDCEVDKIDVIAARTQGPAS